ncbi:Hypothetical protein A7982_08632 [Minicystis rosea]|nr:Hypothetical protein A7982_08632 [Minicystis rosea]
MTTTLTVTALSELVYRYYPRGISPDDPRYESTDEHRRLVEARLRAGASLGAWRSMLGRLRARFPACVVQDRAFHLPSGSHDAAYAAKLLLPATEPEQSGHAIEHALGFLVSILAPCHVIYSSRIAYRIDDPNVATLPEIRLDLSSIEIPPARAIAQEIQASWDTRPLPREIGEVVVPEVATSIRAMGEATIYDCLLSDDW